MQRTSIPDAMSVACGRPIAPAQAACPSQGWISTARSKSRWSHIWVLSSLVLLLKVSAETGASQLHPAPTYATADTTNNIAFQILRLAPIPPERLSEAEAHLNEILTRVGKELGEKAARPTTTWSRNRALATLQTIDRVLLHLGFVYPDSGAVDQFDEALIPRILTETNRLKLSAHPANTRRQRALRPQAPGPVYISDCDTTALLYLGIARQSQLPLRMVLIPSQNRRPGHVFIRWREGIRYVNWETMFGRESTNVEYTQEWHVGKTVIQEGAAMQDLSDAQVLGWGWYLRAVRLERRGEIPMAIESLQNAIGLFPECLDAKRQFAWLAATAAGIPDATRLSALQHARDVCRILSDDPDALDTLAACHAALGEFNDAIRTESLAIGHPHTKTAAKPQYEERLKLYQRSQPFQPERKPRQNH